ncbi:hypothetical protein PENANT_c001G00059 [Penicillium antarcticum]|uniref:Protein kinase domain-containing protein n=1 Tax=Penicillium antarcticum TaxID=416450 RepID=A0A1V6QNM5_9EURO|nr:uncharacterized protein N7508_010174 [Penicillium antarcticum]KAJ5295353.1 hypothetical protein N7508_010174 [Penicillium antarcticum]OQD90587.1 hypothetical protein PENANT_c001G00059 [Penicillium antarcticum]
MPEANIFMDLSEPPLFIDMTGATIPYPEIVGYGSSSVVLQSSGKAVKTPLRRPDSRASEVVENLDTIRLEQMVYIRLQPLANQAACPEVLKWIEFTFFSTELELMRAGTLRNLLDKALIEPPAYKMKAWMRQLARGMMYIHSRNVLVVDVKSWNVLLTDDLMVQYCDFGGSSLLPTNLNMDNVCDCGYTVKIDVALLGAIFYEIATGNRCDVDLFLRNKRRYIHSFPRWPHRWHLPPTVGVFFGGVIERCWMPIEEGGIQTAWELDVALERIEAGLDPSNEPVWA